VQPDKPKRSQNQFLTAVADGRYTVKGIGDELYIVLGPEVRLRRILEPKSYQNGKNQVQKRVEIDPNV
jgi:hypothetical protein